MGPFSSSLPVECKDTTDFCNHLLSLCNSLFCLCHAAGSGYSCSQKCHSEYEHCLCSVKATFAWRLAPEAAENPTPGHGFACSQRRSEACSQEGCIPSLQRSHFDFRLLGWSNGCGRRLGQHSEAQPAQGCHSSIYWLLAVPAGWWPMSLPMGDILRQMGALAMQVAQVPEVNPEHAKAWPRF